MVSTTSTRSRRMPIGVVVALLLATSWAETLEEDMSREQLIVTVRGLKAQLAALAPARAPEPEPRRKSLMRRAAADHAALSVDGGGRVRRPPTDDLPVEHREDFHQTLHGDPEVAKNMLQVGGSDATPPSQAPPLSDATLLQALLPADDLSPESRQDFHQTLHSDPKIAQTLLQGIRELLFRTVHNHQDYVHVGDDDVDGGEHYDDAVGTPISNNTSNGTDATLAGLDVVHAKRLVQEEVNRKVIQLASVERQLGVGNSEELKQLEKDIIDLQAPHALTPTPAVPTATESASAFAEKYEDENRQHAKMILTSFEHALDAVPEPVDQFVDMDIVPTEEEVDTFQKEITGTRDRDSSNASLFGNLMPSDRALLSKRLSPAGDGGTRWPGGIVKFCRGRGLTDHAWKQFKKAYGRMQTHCRTLKFVESSSDCQLTVRGDEKKCNSKSTGYQADATRNVLFLYDFDWFQRQSGQPHCTNIGTVQHEILHALGMSHEQSRSDRDAYVSVNTWNIKKGREHNFEKREKASTLEPYDYRSVMHYGCAAHPNNFWEDTLRASRRRRFWDGHAGRKDCSQMGQRSGLSSRDIAQLQRMYSCSPPPVDWWNDPRVVPA